MIDSFSNKSFKIFVDCNNNFSLATQLIGEQIHYLKLKADPLTLKKINDIAKKNRVLLNPKIRIVDLSNIKKISKKISLIESRG